MKFFDSDMCVVSWNLQYVKLLSYVEQSSDDRSCYQLSNCFANSMMVTKYSSKNKSHYVILKVTKEI